MTGCGDRLIVIGCANRLTMTCCGDGLTMICCGDRLTVEVMVYQSSDKDSGRLMW